jgi:hypothetical protein
MYHEYVYVCKDEQVPFICLCCSRKLFCYCNVNKQKSKESSMHVDQCRSNIRTLLLCACLKSDFGSLQP